VRRSLDQTWQEAMSELNELIHVENPKLDLPDGAAEPPVRGEALRNFARRVPRGGESGGVGVVCR
jgi:hypothetical protein